MRLIPTSVLLVLFSSLALAQTEKLPDILKPDAASEAEAERMGAKVFKLLPFEMFKDANNPLNDEDNPIGILGGGAYYSFTTESHNYHNTPQIGLLWSGRFEAGFSGLKYGFFTNLGKRDLSGIDSTLPEAKYFLSYKPPLFEKDIRQEYASINGRHVDQLTIERSLSPVVGTTYLFRSISFYEADTLVVFQVLKIERDGSVTIAWKKLADFSKPKALYMPDKDLQEKVNAVIAQANIYDIKVVVIDNELYFRGAYVNNDVERLKSALKDNGIQYRGMQYEMRLPKQNPK